MFLFLSLPWRSRSLILPPPPTIRTQLHSDWSLFSTVVVEPARQLHTARQRATRQGQSIQISRYPKNNLRPSSLNEHTYTCMYDRVNPSLQPTLWNLIKSSRFFVLLDLQWVFVSLITLYLPRCYTWSFMVHSQSLRIDTCDALHWMHILVHLDGSYHPLLLFRARNVLAPCSVIIPSEWFCSAVFLSTRLALSVASLTA